MSDALQRLGLTEADLMEAAEDANPAWGPVTRDERRRQRVTPQDMRDFVGGRERLGTRVREEAE